MDFNIVYKVWFLMKGLNLLMFIGVFNIEIIYMFILV